MRAARTAQGRSVAAAQGDISREEDVDALVRTAVDGFGRLDVLVNNAGVFSNFLLEHMEPDEFQRILDVNVRGAFLCIRAAAAQMRAQGGGGSIVNITSIDAIHPSGVGPLALRDVEARDLGADEDDGARARAPTGSASTPSPRGRRSRRVRSSSSRPAPRRGSTSRRSGGPTRPASRSGGSRIPTTSRARRCSSPPISAPTSTAPSSSSTAGSSRHDDERRAFPEFIRALPMVDSPLASLRGWMQRTEQALTMFYEIPDGVEVPEHAHGAQWGVVLEGTVEFTIGGETRTYGPGDTFSIADGVAAPRDHLSGLRRHRRLRRRRPLPGEDELDELAGVDRQRAAGHQQRQVARAEEHDARDVVRDGDTAERQPLARAPRARTPPASSAARCASRPSRQRHRRRHLEHADPVRAELERERPGQRRARRTWTRRSAPPPGRRCGTRRSTRC